MPQNRNSVPVLFADPCFLNHETGRGHPESPVRLSHLYAHLEHRPVLGRYAMGEFKPASKSHLGLIHSDAYIDRVQQFAAAGGGRIEADTVVSRQSFEIASRAAGAALAAVDGVLAGDHPRALCLARSPGHHALHDDAMGFCLFNNVAVAAAYALNFHELDRILIVDWDVHHGNGTQDVFYDSEKVWFFSAHRFPFYPGTGTTNETGTGAGLGATFNLPIPFGTARADYLKQFDTVLEQAATRCQPQLILISAGFDSHRADPIGSLKLETEDFAHLTRSVVQVAEQHCQGRIVSLLEGGYDVNALAESVECHMESLWLAK